MVFVAGGGGAARLVGQHGPWMCAALVVATSAAATTRSQQQQQQQQQQQRGSPPGPRPTTPRLAADRGGWAFGSVADWVAQEPLEASAARAAAALEADGGWVSTDGSVGSLDDNVCFGTLGARTNALRLFRTYARRDGSEVVALATFHRQGVSGHPSVVHGGLISMLCDQAFGWANGASMFAAASEGGLLDAASFGSSFGAASEKEEAAKKKPSPELFGFTAFLHVDYRRPVAAGSSVRLVCALDRSEGRKRFFVGQMTDLVTGAVLCDANALFVMPRPPQDTPTAVTSVAKESASWRTVLRATPLLGALFRQKQTPAPKDEDPPA